MIRLLCILYPLKPLGQEDAADRAAEVLLRIRLVAALNRGSINGLRADRKEVCVQESDSPPFIAVVEDTVNRHVLHDLLEPPIVHDQDIQVQADYPIVPLEPLLTTSKVPEGVAHCLDGTGLVTPIGELLQCDRSELEATKLLPGQIRWRVQDQVGILQDR